MEDRFTIEEWFTLLEPGIREKAMARRGAYRGSDRETSYHESLAKALGSAFVWSETPEKHNYWKKVRDNAIKETRKPATNRGMIDCTIGE